MSSESLLNGNLEEDGYSSFLDVPPESRAARFTTFSLRNSPDHGFDPEIENVDRLFAEVIIPLALKQRGFLGCRRLLDFTNGKCVVVSFWSSRQYADESLSDKSYYSHTQTLLLPHIRYGQFKTETFEIQEIASKNAGRSGLRPRASSVASINDSDPFGPVSCCARLTTLQITSPEQVPGLDEAFAAIVADGLGDLAGYRGAQRFFGVPGSDTSDTYIFASYWDSVGTLRASERSNLEVIKLKEKFSLGKVSTQVYTHQQLFRSNLVGQESGSLFEEGSGAACTLQLACISLGVGIFVTPGVFASMGLLTGTLLIVGFALCSDFCMQIMLLAAERYQCNTYEGVLEQGFGKLGRSGALVAIAIACLTANCAHMQFVASMFNSLQGDGGGFIRNVFGADGAAQQVSTVVLFGVLVFPLCLKRRLSDLRFVSLGVVVFCLLVSLVVVVKFCTLISKEGLHNTQLIKPISLADFASEAPIACFGFSIIAEVFAVRAEALEPKKLGRSVHVATAIVCAIYCVVGITGALALENPASNVLLQKDFQKDRLVLTLCLGLVFTLTLLYPLINFPTVMALDSIWIGPQGAPSLKRRRIFSVFVLVVVILIVGFLPGLPTVFGLTGSLGLGLLAFVLPCLGLLALARQERKEQDGRADSINYAGGGDANNERTRGGSAAVSRPLILVALVVLTVGLAMSVGSTFWIVYTATVAGG